MHDFLLQSGEKYVIISIYRLRMVFPIEKINYGVSFMKNSKKMKFCALTLCAALCMPLLMACGSSVPDSGSAVVNNRSSEFDLETYKDTVRESYNSITSTNASTAVAVMATWEMTAWERYQKFMGDDSSIDDLADRALESMEKETELTANDLKEAYDTIRQQYKEISLIEIEGVEAEKISKAYETMYNAYKDMYDAVMNPGNSFMSFAEKVGTAAESFQDANDELVLWLDIEENSVDGSGE